MTCRSVRRDSGGFRMLVTMCVLTLRPDDGPPMHVVCDTPDDADGLLARLRARLGEEVTHRIDEKPASWECDGRDGCFVDA